MTVADKMACKTIVSGKQSCSWAGPDLLQNPEEAASGILILTPSESSKTVSLN